MLGRLILVAGLALTCAYAQEEGGSGGGGGGGGGRGGGGGGSGMPSTIRKQTKLEEFGDRLRLNKEQGPEVEKILSEGVQQAATVRSQLEKVRAALAESIINGKGDDEFKKLQEAYTSVSMQLTGIEAKVFAQILATLKPNQVSKPGQAFELLDGYFDEAPRPAMGGRGGPGAGRGGGR